ncbi:MAG: V-type ATPase subunit [Treponema sp.]|jgi:vacuolar-type H+-ATPase subunit C/Vma6|nr:V-type ATPase subunit [Treponema sp.]
MVISGERAYIYAKICGIIGKSFVGKRVSTLGGINRLAELDRIVFPSANKDLPERELLPDLERRISEKTIQEIINIIKCFKKPPEFLVLLVRAYEYADMKTVLSALEGRETKSPLWTDIGEFRTVNFEAYPDTEKMLRGTEFEFLLKEDMSDIVSLQTKLDRHYYSAIWNALSKLPKNDRKGIEKIIGKEINLRNVAWVLRLRTYYNMKPEKIKDMLIFIEGKNTFTDDSLESLDFALDVRSEWTKWKWAAFVNEEKTGNYWKIDPRYFQNHASAFLYKSTYHSLRASPFTLDSIFCFIRLKQFEEDILTSIAEGFGFNMTAYESLNLLGAI